MSVFAGARTPLQGGDEQDRAALGHLYAWYLGGDATSVASFEDATLLGVKRFKVGDMTPRSFSEFMAGMYTIVKQMSKAIHERTAWLLDLEKQQLHWRLLGLNMYDDYLDSIDPFGQVKEIVNLHETTLKRKRVAES